MKVRSQTYKCADPGCGYTSIVLVQLADGVESLTENCPLTAPCDVCEGVADRIFGAPPIMVHHYASGTNRGYIWDKTKEIERLRSASFGVPHEKRGEMQKEIDRLGRKDIPEGSGFKR
jgi:hypothetical protein